MSPGTKSKSGGSPATRSRPYRPPWPCRPCSASITGAVDHPAGAVDRHRRRDAEQRERFRPLLTASQNRRAMSFDFAARRLRHPQSRVGRRRPRRTQMKAAGWTRRGIGSPTASAAIVEADQARDARRVRPAGRSLRRPSNRGERFRPGQAAHTGAVLGIAMAGFRAHRRGQVPIVPGDDVKIAFLVQATGPTSGRQLHRRRLLREQDERVRLQVRLRAHPRVSNLRGMTTPPRARAW